MALKEGRLMRKIALGVFLVSGLEISGSAQTVDRLMTALKVEADSIQFLESGQPGGQLILSGDVVISVNGVRLTADAAVVPLGSKIIELNGGSARVELPSFPTSIGTTDRSKR
jgi:lipopolysaccharide export system protein LptA